MGRADGAVGTEVDDSCVGSEVGPDEGTSEYVDGCSVGSTVGA